MLTAPTYEQEIRDAEKFHRKLMSGTPAQRKRKALAFLVRAGILDRKGRLTAHYR